MKKTTRADLPILKGEIDVEYIEVDGKKLVVSPFGLYTDIHNHITHDNCVDCGKEFEKRFAYDKQCVDCGIAKETEIFLSLELVEWTGEPLYLFGSTDQYFFSEEDIDDYCDGEDLVKSELRLVICRGTTFAELDFDWITSDGELVHEDWEPSKEIEDKLREFNDFITAQSTNTYFPTDKRVQL